MGNASKVFGALGQGLLGLSNTIVNAEEMKQRSAESAARLEDLKARQDEMEFNRAANRIDMGLKLESTSLRKKYFEGAGKQHLQKVFGDSVADNFVNFVSSNEGSSKGAALFKLIGKNPQEAQKLIKDMQSSGAIQDEAVANDLFNSYLERAQKMATLQKTTFESGAGGELGKRQFDTAQKQVQDIDSSVAKVLSENPGVNRNMVLMQELRNRGMSLSQYNQKRQISESGNIVGQGSGSGAVDEQPMDDGGKVFNPNSFKEETEISKQFESQQPVKDYNVIRPFYKKLVSSANNKTTAGDIGVVFSYMKMLDPGSRITEGEVTSVEQAPNVPSRIIGAYNRLVQTGKFDDNFRQEILSAAKGLNEVNEKEYRSVVKRFTKMASKRGLDPENIITSFDEESDPNSGPTMSPEDEQALQWANSNPNDPRAAKIKARLGVR